MVCLGRGSWKASTIADSNLSRLRKECREEKTSNGFAITGDVLFMKQLLRIACDRLKDKSKVRPGVHTQAFVTAQVKAAAKQHRQTRIAVVNQGDRVCQKADALRGDLGAVLSNPQMFGIVAERACQKEVKKAADAIDRASKAKCAAAAMRDVRAKPRQQEAKDAVASAKYREASDAVKSFGLMYPSEGAAQLRNQLAAKLQACSVDASVDAVPGDVA